MSVQGGDPGSEDKGLRVTYADDVRGTYADDVEARPRTRPARRASMDSMSIRSVRRRSIDPSLALPPQFRTMYSSQLEESMSMY